VKGVVVVEGNAESVPKSGSPRITFRCGKS